MPIDLLDFLATSACLNPSNRRAFNHPCTDLTTILQTSHLLNETKIKMKDAEVRIHELQQNAEGEILKLEMRIQELERYGLIAIY